MLSVGSWRDPPAEFQLPLGGVTAGPGVEVGAGEPVEFSDDGVLSARTASNGRVSTSRFHHYLGDLSDITHGMSRVSGRRPTAVSADGSENHPTAAVQRSGIAGVCSSPLTLLAVDRQAPARHNGGASAEYRQIVDIPF